MSATDRRLGRWDRLVLGAIPFALLIAAYAVGSHLRRVDNPSDKLLPSFGSMAEVFWRMATAPDQRTGDLLLWSDTAESLARLAGGIFIATVVSVSLGVLIGFVPRLRAPCALRRGDLAHPADHGIADPVHHLRPWRDVEGHADRHRNGAGDDPLARPGIPFDSGTTYRPGTRFGPQGIRRISALYTPYNYELGVDLREQMTLCDAGDVFTIPANLEKSFDQITRGVAHIFSSGALPLMLGGDHSIGFPCVRGIAQCTSKRIGIIHFDRHIDIQEKDLDERMHTTPWYWATNLPNVPAVNLVQLGIGGWQVPRYGVAEARKRQTNVLTIADIEDMGLDKAAEVALDLAWHDADAVYISFDVDSIDCGFVPGTGWPEPGGFLPREALKLLGLVAAEGLCGLEVVEVSPPYDTSDITALVGVRVVVEALGALVAHGKMGSHKAIIDKPVSY
jgi:agmatinase